MEFAFERRSADDSLTVLRDGEVSMLIENTALAHDRKANSGKRPRSKRTGKSDSGGNAAPKAARSASSEKKREPPQRAQSDAPFGSILFPAGCEQLRNETGEMPECFTDLNLDQVIAAVIAKQDATVLQPFFYSTYRDAEILRYRQDVFRELANDDLRSSVTSFCERMNRVRLELGYAKKIQYKCHRQVVIFRAIRIYCQSIETLASEFRNFDLISEGFLGFRRHLEKYRSSEEFAELVEEARDLQERLSTVQYSMLVHGGKVTVRKYASERDYSAIVLDQFKRFRTETNQETERKPRDTESMNHIEEGILDLVGKLYPEIFSALQDYLRRHDRFIDETMALFDREIQFYLTLLAYIAPIKQKGLAFCIPEISASDRAGFACESFDLALAAKLVGEKQGVICNDFHLDGPERMIVVSGPNQGGKTTFARMFGQLHFLAGLGCPVPGRKAKLFLADQIFTHFEREEDISNLRGKLEDELVRLHETIEAMTDDSVVILNEIFNSTSLQDQIFLSRRILEAILATDALCVCVTFIDELSSLNEKTVSMVSTVVPEDPATRTFRIVRKPADGLAYALSLAERRKVTHEQLLKRIPR